MNKKVNLDKDAMKFLYARYKDYLLPIAAIFICILLFFYVITPQVQNIKTLQTQEREEARKLDILKNNLNLLYSLDPQTLDKQLKLASKALPTDKDFIGILSGVAIASSKSNVTLGDYGFQVGEIGKTQTGAKGIPTMLLSLTVSGNINSLMNFMNELKKTVPLSEIKTVSLSGNNTSLSTVFYYKPLSPVVINDTVPLSPLSNSALDQLNNISNMNNTEIISEEYVPQASVSGAAFLRR
jgi:hypothetical protein